MCDFFAKVYGFTEKEQQVYDEDKNSDNFYWFDFNNRGAVYGASRPS